MDSSELLLRIGYGACAVLALGALAPWAELGEVTASGVDSPDGMTILALAAIGAAALWRWSQMPGREVLIGVLVVGGAALALSGFNALDLSRQIEGSGVSLGWGLGLTIAASLGLVAVGALLLHSEHR